MLSDISDKKAQKYPNLLSPKPEIYKHIKTVLTALEDPKDQDFDLSILRNPLTSAAFNRDN